ncbi:MAG: helix-turn-helix transcriptional regulator [Thermoleophilia bacterium]|nr:helix-turn-helix transcriptional regulator [Thermoleophilia bacterium]
MASQADIDAHRAFAGRFGKNLVRARRATRISQETLGFETSLHRTEVGTLERGVRIPRLDTALKLARVLGVPIDALVEGIEWSAGARNVGHFREKPHDDPHGR